MPVHANELSMCCLLSLKYLFPTHHLENNLTILQKIGFWESLSLPREE